MAWYTSVTLKFEMFVLKRKQFYSACNSVKVNFHSEFQSCNILVRAKNAKCSHVQIDVGTVTYARMESRVPSLQTVNTVSIKISGMFLIFLINESEKVWNLSISISAIAL